MTDQFNSDDVSMGIARWTATAGPREDVFSQHIARLVRDICTPYEVEADAADFFADGLLCGLKIAGKRFAP